MRKIFAAVAVGAVALCVSAGSASAQGGGPGGGRGRMMEMMFQGITLTDAQVAQRDSIVKVFQAQMPAFTPGTPPSDEDRQKRQAVMMKQQEALKAILTDEQKKIFEKNLEEMRNRQRPPQN